MNFPSPPWTDGQVSGNYVYSTARGLWESKPLTGPKSTYGVQPPLNPQAGDEWINSNDMTAFGWYVDTDGGQWVEKTASISANGYYSPNYIINGAFDIWQRGTDFTLSNTTKYTADRWAGISAGGIKVTQITNSSNLPQGANFAARLQRTAGSVDTNSFYFGKAFEGVSDIAPLRGKTVTVSFYARAGANYSSTTNKITIVTGSGADVTLTTDPVSPTFFVFNITGLSTTWKRFNFSFTIPSSDVTGRMFFEGTPSGIAGAADYIDFYGVQLEEGSVATPFRRNANSIQGELAACQRYYWRASSAGYQQFGTGLGANTYAVFGVVNVPVQLRAFPTSVDFSGIQLGDGASYPQANNVIITGYPSTLSQIAVSVTTASAVLTQYRPYLIQTGVPSGYLGFSAEL